MLYMAMLFHHIPYASTASSPIQVQRPKSYPMHTDIYVYVPILPARIEPFTCSQWTTATRLSATKLLCNSCPWHWNLEIETN